MTTARHLSSKGVRPQWQSSQGDAVTATYRRLVCFDRIVATWHAAVSFLVPVGYEDESGFHYGEPPARNRRDPAVAS